MLILFSHLLAFSTLFIAAISDLKTTDVPDIFGIVGVVGGIALHAGASYVTGSLDPLLWSLGAGIAFSLYGWGFYLLDMWGGADAFAMSVLGFAAPYSLSGMGLLHGVNLFVNVMLLGFIYSLVFATYKALQAGGVFRETARLVEEREKRIALEVLAAGAFSALIQYAGMNGALYFVAMVALIFLYRFFQVLQDEAMAEEIRVSELEEGAVVDLESIDISIAREKNGLGRRIEMLREKMGARGLPGSDYLRDLEERAGYPQIVGITGEEIDRLEESDIEKVEVLSGARFVPVFPVALAVTDIFGGGLLLLLALF
ncbi:MAG: A24 family peptidase [Candidatus Nanohaloarchaea archaeon]